MLHIYIYTYVYHCICVESSEILAIAIMAFLVSALMPIMAFLVSYHLGAEWVVLINFQTVQGLMCENRKWIHRGDNEDSNQRRPGWPERKAVYRAWLEIFSRD